MRAKITPKDIYKIAIKNRENHFQHHDYRKNMLQYELVMRGDKNALEVFRQQEQDNQYGHLSDNPLRNDKYLFVCHATHLTDCVIQSGVDAETAYNTSDLFIQRMDELTTRAEIDNLKYEMINYYINLVNHTKRKHVYSAIILQSLDYIEQHLHEHISLGDVAEYVNRSSGYLSSLFKQEMHIGMTEYILQQKISIAKYMICHMNRPYIEISDSLGFSSQSYFIKEFKRVTGMTPGEYRKNHYNKDNETKADISPS